MRYLTSSAVQQELSRILEFSSASSLDAERAVAQVCYSVAQGPTFCEGVLFCLGLEDGGFVCVWVFLFPFFGVCL